MATLGEGTQIAYQLKGGSWQGRGGWRKEREGGGRGEGGGGETQCLNEEVDRPKARTIGQQFQCHPH